MRTLYLCLATGLLMYPKRRNVLHTDYCLWGNLSFFATALVCEGLEGETYRSLVSEQLFQTWL